MLYLKKGTMAIQDVKANDPFVLWIEGGPGCSGVYSSFTQHGPFHVESDQSITLRDYAWNEQAHLMYIDQPFGTGLSYYSGQTLVDNSYTAMTYVVDALQQFFETYPQFKQAAFYICGESYGGHYVPMLAMNIFAFRLNEKINYKGIMIGGAWTFPTKQISQVPSQLFSFGMIDQLRFATLTEWSIKSLEYIDQKKFNEFLELSDELFFAEQFLGPNFRYNMQIYDFLDDSYYIDFINTHKSQFETKITFEECNQNIYKAFAEDQAKSMEEQVLFLLDRGKVLIFNGQFDTVITTPGAQNWINQMQWSKIYQWKQQPKQIWKVNNEPAGTIKSFENFSFATVYLGGHMTATDIPQSASQLLRIFLN